MTNIKYPDFDDRALCRSVGTEFYFPEPGLSTGFEIDYVKRMCGECYFQTACAEWAIYNEPHGIWGGLTPLDRRHIRMQRGVKYNGSFFTDEDAVALRQVAS